MANWQDIKTKIANFRNYVQGLTPAGKAAAKYSFLITKDDIKAMLAQAGGQAELDGLRIYLGADIVESQLVPNVTIVAVQKDAAGDYNDYRIGNNLPPDPAPLVAVLHPCPPVCGKTNILNS
jgi:hypothetical protein